MTPCGKFFCTCCKTAYVAGFLDGVQTGFITGYRRGHRDGYVSGYLDAEAGNPPPPEYEGAIEVLRHSELQRIRAAGRRDCGCYFICSCDSPS